MFHDLGAALAGLTAPALAIVAVTALVRLLMHPLARAAIRGEKARAALSPQVRALTDRYRHDPRTLQQKTLELYRESGVSMFTGCLPALVQIPVFMLVYRLVTTDSPLLAGTLFGAPLGTHWLGAFAFTPVFIGLFAALAAVAYATSRWQAAQALRTGAPELPMARWLRLLPFGTVPMAAVLPLAAGVYLVTTTTWTLVERVLLHRLL
ncbi:YidC/Oxa1 family membrane protein insertase [Actinokineospora sp. NPDC004072]